ncbi:MAG: trypsin-like serine protease [Burkholderiales bacterium]|nr:trypsin-like serine protease [Burkholderiales bacterium]
MKSLIIKLLPILLITGLTACNSGSTQANSPSDKATDISSKIVNGKNFQSLPDGSQIAEFAKATIGLKKYQFGYCTGVAIKDDLLVTAAHCVEGVKKLGISINPPKNGDEITLNTYNKSTNSYKDKDVVIKDIHAGYGYKMNPVEYGLYDGSDIAIIRFAPHTFDYWIPSNSILNNLINESYDQTKSRFAKMAIKSGFTKNIPELYAFGWASTFPSKYQFEMNKQGSPNFISYYNYDSVLGHKIPVQVGDSGGPIYLCEANGQNCILIAITSSGDSDKDPINGSETSVMLTNPHFSKLVHLSI